jgi:hypothetical protein
MNAAVGIAMALTMWVTGAGDPIFWGTVAFLLNYVPILGTVVGAVIFLFAGLLTIDTLWQALLLDFMHASTRSRPLGWTRRGGDLLGTAALEDFTPRYIRFALRRCQNFTTAASVSPIRALTTTTSNTSRALVM